MNFALFKKMPAQKENFFILNYIFYILILTPQPCSNVDCKAICISLILKIEIFILFS